MPELLDLTTDSVDPTVVPDAPDTPVQEMLRNLQGNVLTHHGRNEVRLIFLRFTAPPPRVAAWMSGFARRYVTSARAQLDAARSFAANGMDGGLFATFFLTAAGYEEGLRLSAAKFPEGAGPITGAQFKTGMVAAGSALNDSAPNGWDEPFRSAATGGGRIHGMILLADDDGTSLDAATVKIVAGLVGVGTVLYQQPGKALGPRNRRTEPFGFRDGLSQPLFLVPDLLEEQSRGGLSPWNPKAPLDLALLQDPFAGQNCFGSYLVLRKLEQNVRRFKQQESDLATALNLLGSDRERTGAMVIGRFRDGTPLVSAPAATGREPVNSFNYLDDSPPRSKCPFHSHIRVLNPREGLANAPVRSPERMHRIVRRAVPYDDRPEERGEADPEARVGLLFMCYQSDISNQFAFLQSQWANLGTFHGALHPMPDILIGRSQGAPFLPDWPQVWGQAGTQSSAFDSCVELKGGEFFFSPSIPFLLKPPVSVG